MFDLNSILLIIHITLMGYWLGGDLGVYLSANRVADASLNLDERLRFLKLAMILDMGPRSALILMLPTGFHMTTNYGLVSLSNPNLMLIWIGALIWLSLCWAAFLFEDLPVGEIFRKIDLNVRFIMAPIILLIALWGLFSENSEIGLWLSIKLLLFASIITLGITLRMVVSKWAIGFKMLRENESIDEANNIIFTARQKAKKQVLSIWAFVFICGYLGITKLS